MKLAFRNRILSILSFGAVLALMTAIPTSSLAQAKPEQLNKSELTSLIANARTPADHQRIATYYRAQADNYTAEAQEHEAMVAAYKANPTRVNNKNEASTIGHCEYFVKSLNMLAMKSRELAALHEKMATEATNQ